jgi:hypothetical protein
MPELRAISHKIKKFYYEVGGDIDLQEDDSGPPQSVEDVDDVIVEGGDLSHDDLVHFLNTLTDKMAAALEKFADRFIEEHGIPSSLSDKQNFHGGMTLFAEDVQKVVKDEFRLTDMMLQNTIMAHQNSEEVQQAFVRMQVSHPH